MIDESTQLPTEIEALIRAAGNYVRPSDDLRPRVLESARAEVNARQINGRLRVWVVAAVVLFMLLANPRHESAPQAVAVIPLRPAVGSRNQDNPSWDTVDAMRGMRRRLAVLWQSAL